MKFVADRTIFKSTDAVEYKTASEAKGSSQLALELFNFPFVSGVFIASGFVTVTKTANISWDLITFELREFIREFLLKSEWAVEKIPTPVETSDAEKAESISKKKIAPSEFDEIIEQILIDQVKPAVESDGGAIDYVSFEDGTVTVQLRGSCSGCPSATVTLKDGIERLLSAEIPEVKKVVAESL